jgi:hypothetical protein
MSVAKGCFLVKYFPELGITLRPFIPQFISYVIEVNLNFSLKKFREVIISPAANRQEVYKI